MSDQKDGFTRRAFLPATAAAFTIVPRHVEWVDACKGGPPANCNFEFAAPITEIALLGAIAQRTGRYLAWDAARMRFTNDEDANRFLTPAYRQGWSL